MIFQGLLVNLDWAYDVQNDEVEGLKRPEENILDFADYEKKFAFNFNNFNDSTLVDDALKKEIMRLRKADFENKREIVKLRKEFKRFKRIFSGPHSGGIAG